MFRKRTRPPSHDGALAEMFFALSPDGMLIMRGGAFIGCNPAAERIYDAPRARIIGASPLDFSAPVQADGRPSPVHVGERLQEAQRAGHARFEWHNQRRDGTLVRILVTLIPTRIENDEALLVLVQDLAETAQVVDQITNGLAQLARGDLTCRIDSRFRDDYEPLRESFNGSVAAMNQTIDVVSNVAARVRASAGEIDGATDDLSQRTHRQAASLRSTSEAMGRVTDMVQETARGARRVSRGIGETERVANEGGQVVDRAVEAMQAIDHSSGEITQIISVIDGISFQTNLLALNAGVEAARAGESGKGFAVVATEVRALAQRSAQAATDIGALITKSSEQVKTGVSLVAETGAMLRQIVERVSEINTLAGAISESAETQASEVNQIKEAIAEMDRMLGHSGAVAEQSSGTARQLAQEAEELARLVAGFDTGKKAGTAPYTATARAA